MLSVVGWKETAEDAVQLYFNYCFNTKVDCVLSLAGIRSYHTSSGAGGEGQSSGIVDM